MIERISKSNEIIKNIKSMFNNNKDENLIITDDITIIELAFKYKKEFNTFIYCFDETYHEDTKSLIDNIITISKNTYEISKSTYQSLAQKENSQGCIAIIENKLITFDELKNKNFLVILNSLEIPGNIGTILRTVDSAAVDGIILVDSISKIQNSKITSSARGTNLLIPICNSNYVDTQKWLLDNDYDIYLGEPKLGINYQKYEYSNKIAIVVGNERFGINDNWYKNKHKKVFIPMNGSCNSLNVSIAASILIYEAAMKRNNFE